MRSTNDICKNLNMIATFLLRNNIHIFCSLRMHIEPLYNLRGQNKIECSCECLEIRWRGNDVHTLNVLEFRRFGSIVK